jgi:hyaluronan synthase
MIVVGAAVALATAILSGNLHLEFSLLPDSRLATLFWWTALLYGSITYAALVWRVILWRRYRPMAPVADQSLPTLSVVIPAYNEGALVRQSILSTAASHYPAEKLEIIAIDDGSTDDTWLHIRAAAGEVDPAIRIVTHKQPRNLGKREALNHGFSVGSGDVFVSMDSDSVLHPDALRNGVAPLVRDPSIGCVAGCVEVLNPRQSWITRFLRCTFSLSFKFVRAYQSEFRGVFCTPGALSFYRANIIRKVKDEWVRQTFLGQPCTIGEDRALTNLILREGWMTTYQGNALVYSEMPHTYVGLCKMLLRWGRSNVRETVVMAPWLLTNFRTKYLRRFQFNMLLTIVTLFLPPVLILNSWLLLLTQSGYLLHQLGLVMIYAATTSIIYYMNEKDNEWVWLFAYEFFWTSCLSWIIPWSVITVKNTKWLTRGASLRQGAVVDSPSPRSFSLPSLLAPGDAPILHPAVASPSR